MKESRTRFISLVFVIILTACRSDPDEIPTRAIPLPTMVPIEATVTGEGMPAVEGPSLVAEQEEQNTSANTDSSALTTEPEEITIEAADGLALAGTFYPGHGSGPWPGVLLLHMNGGHRQDWVDVAEDLGSNGYGVLALDMRGHGDTGNKKDWDAARDDLQRAWAYLSGRRDVDAERTAIVGASIGANMALVTGVAELAVKSVVLLSPGLDYFGVTTDDQILTYGQRPILIVASEEDRESASSSRTLHELALGDVRLEMYNGAGHGTRMFGPRPELTELLLDWLDNHVKEDNPAISEASASGSPASEPLFAFDWDDRSPFQAGLIESEVAVLDQMPGATVYHMDLSLSPDLLTVNGQQALRYTNQEERDLSVIYFHLFPNLLGGVITLSNLVVDGVPVNPEYITYPIRMGPPESSSSPLVDVATVMSVPLEPSLKPGEQTIIELSFITDVPTEGGSNYGVFAAIDGVLALAHFYPQIAVYDESGWNVEIPSPNADVTYADSSYYLVRLTAPAGQVPVTSGVEIERQENGDTKTFTFAAGPVRDFYLATSDQYTVVSQSVGQTKVNSYGFSQFNDQMKLALVYSSDALESFNNRFGVYPFVEFDIAPTPNLALGIEYPGVVVIRSALYDPAAILGQTPAINRLESTVAHEVGHQWFYSVVGNDQLDEPWVDESLTQYITYLYYLDTYGPAGAAEYRESWLRRWRSVDLTDEIPIGMPAGNYNGIEYSAIVYGRGPLFFEALAEEMGQEIYDTFLQDYYQSYKWGITTGEDLKVLAEIHCSCDLGALFDQWVNEQ